MRRTFAFIVLMLILACSNAMAGEGRIPVYESGAVLSENGDYILTRNIPANPSGPAIQITARRVTLDLNGFNVYQGTNTADPAIYVSQPKADVVIRNGIINGGSAGIKVVGSLPSDPDNSVKIENVMIQGGVCVDVQGVSSVVVRGNTMRGCSKGVSIGCSGSCDSRAIQGSVEENLFLQCDTGVEVSDVKAFAIARNRVLQESFGGDALTVLNSTSVTVKDNRLSNGGIRLTDVRGSTIVGNTIEGRLGGSSVGIIDDELSRSNRYVGNTIENVSQNGILLAGDANFVAENQANNCGGFGLFFDVSSEGNYYLANLAAGNGGGSCATPAGSDACLDGSGHVSAGSNVFAGALQ